MPVEIHCHQCGKETRVIPSRAESAKFCSRACHYEWNATNLKGENSPRWQGGERSKICEHCGEVFSKPRRRAISLFVNQKFCSKACADKGGFRYFGEANPKWNGKPRRKHPGRHAAWARAVISRDKATCQICAAAGVELHAHHIKSYKDHPELRWDVSNGLTVCHRCHWNLHTGTTANGVNSGKLAAGHAGDNPEPSLGRKPSEGVTTRGRAYRRFEGSCDNCGTFISKRWSDVAGKPHLYCGKSCMMAHRWKLMPEKMNRPRR